MASQDFKKWIRYTIAGILLSIMGGSLAIRLSHEHFDLSNLAVFPQWGIWILLGMVSTAWICNGLRTWILSRVVGNPIPALKSIGITLSMEFAIAATPAGVGGMITRIGLQKRQGMPFEKSTSLMSADWIADLLFFVILAPFGLWKLWDFIPWNLLHLPVWWDWRWIVGGIGVAAWVPFGLTRNKRKLTWLLPKVFRKRIQHIKIRIQNELGIHVTEIRSTFALILSNHRMDYLGVIGLATVQWICRYGILVVVLDLLGNQVNPIVIMLIQGSLFLLAMFIVIPGGGGTVEILTSLILAPMVGAPTAAIAVVIWRFFTYYVYLIGGGISFAINTRNWLFKSKPETGIINETP